MGVCKSVINSGGIAATRIDAENNKVIMENGKEVEYDVLMIASGMGKDFESIQGLTDALEDPKSRVFSNSIISQNVGSSSYI